MVPLEPREEPPGRRRSSSPWSSSSGPPPSSAAAASAPRCDISSARVLGPPFVLERAGSEDRVVERTPLAGDEAPGTAGAVTLVAGVEGSAESDGPAGTRCASSTARAAGWCW